VSCVRSTACIAGEETTVPTDRKRVGFLTILGTFLDLRNPRNMVPNTGTDKDSDIVIDIQSESLARGPKILFMYTVEQRGFLVRKNWQTGSFKACQMAFRTEFGERRAPSKCCI